MRFSNTYQVSTSETAEIKPPVNGRCFIALDNQSGNPIRYDYDVIPTDTGGNLLNNNMRYEIALNPPQGKLYIRGTVAGLQSVTVTQENIVNYGVRPNSASGLIWRWINGR